MSYPEHPTYVSPAVSLRATWSATDGSRPEEVTVDWREPPALDEVVALVNILLAGGGQVTTVGMEDPEIERHPQNCNVALETGTPGQDHLHICVLPPGHEPVEVEGRAHRCYCGGIFAAEGETLDVPGRSSRERERRH